MPTINEKVLTEACRRAKKAYPKYSDGVSKPFFCNLIRQVYKEEERGIRFQEALRLSLNSGNLGNKDRSIYRHALGSYFGQISGLAKKARGKRSHSTRWSKAAKPNVSIKKEPNGQLAWRI